MGLLDQIEKLREKPEATRRRVAIMVTSLIVLVVMGIWITLNFALNHQFEEKSNIASPFSVIKDIFK